MAERPSCTPESEQSTSSRTRLPTRREFLGGAAMAAGALAFYSGEIARHELSITTPTVRIDRLPPAFHGLRVVQISDIHYDQFTEPSFLERVVLNVNRLQPDLVLLTGDFVTRGPMLSLAASQRSAFPCARLLSRIHCPSCFAVLGNHDVGVGAQIVISALAASGIPLLADRYVSLERSGQRLWLAGVIDPVSLHPNLDAALPARPDGPVILMSHGPDFADAVVRHPLGQNVDLIVSGHTHGGQVRLPVVGALHLPVGGKLYPEGLYRLGRTQLYVNRGIGAVGLPFRLYCPPEITVFTLLPA